MKTGKIDLGRNISSTVAIFIILILSVTVAWFSLSASQKIIDSASASQTFNYDYIKKINSFDSAK
jgi:hypothetical protein